MADEKRKGRAGDEGEPRADDEKRDGEQRVRQAAQGRSARGASEVRAVLDRVEDGDIAVLILEDEDETQLDLPLASLPEGATDGDHFRLTFDDGGGDPDRRRLLSVARDDEARANAERRVRALQQSLEQKSNTQGKKNFKL
ncbi:MAG TPA: DUF3006 domain-containing protein [Pyrinomonadaceae bacterium]|nr:DUF3006 domain-containing protein [Pyrinomonadaceae bacterium]